MGLQLYKLIFFISVAKVGAQCHNRCSGHGDCDRLGRCKCYSLYTGADCSLRTCPYGPAWVDYAVADQVAHQPAECSNRGHCDRTNGKCACESGFSGIIFMLSSTHVLDHLCMQYSRITCMISWWVQVLLVKEVLAPMTVACMGVVSQCLKQLIRMTVTCLITGNHLLTP